MPPLPVLHLTLSPPDLEQMPLRAVYLHWYMARILQTLPLLTLSPDEAAKPAARVWAPTPEECHVRP